MPPKSVEKSSNSASSSDEDSSKTSSSSSSSDDEQQQQQEPRPSKKAKTTTIVASKPLEILAQPSPSNNNGSSILHGGAATSNNNNNNKPIIVILDQASLETVKNKRGIYELLNCDDHREYCKRKLRKDPNEFRPDILHQEMLALLDSPLNKAGLLKLYVSTKRKVLIDVNPSLRMPRTYKRFAGLMTQLLHKMKIKAGADKTTLLKVIKNPVSQYLPAGTRAYGFSCQGQLYSPIAFAKTTLPVEPSTTSSNAPICFVLGAMSTGHVTIDDYPFIERMISLSEYPLSGAAAISRLCGGIENHWGIV